MANLISGWTIRSIEDGAEGADLTSEFACINPASLRKAMGASRVSPIFIDRANSYYCPWGYPYGQAWLLIDGRTLRQLKMNKRQKVRCYITEVDGDKDTKKRNQNRELVFNSLYIQRAICVSGAAVTLTDDQCARRSLTQPMNDPYNDQDVFLLELVDLRYLLRRFTAVNAGYNVPSIPNFSNLTDSVNGVTGGREGFFFPSTLKYHSSTYDLYNRYGIVRDLFSKIGTSLLHGQTTLTFKGYFYGVNNSPNDWTASGADTLFGLEYYGWNCWDALHDVLQLLNEYVYFDPTTGKFETRNKNDLFYDVGVKDYFLESPEIIQYLHSQKLFDYRVRENLFLQIPSSVKVVHQLEPVHYTNANVWEASSTDERHNAYGQRFHISDLSEYDPSDYLKYIGKGGVDTEILGTAIPGTVENIIPNQTLLYSNVCPTDDVPPQLLNACPYNTLAFEYLSDGGFPLGPFSSRNTHAFGGKVLYAGLAHFYKDSKSQTPTYLTANQQIGHIIWRDYGDGNGLVTEVFNCPNDNMQIVPRPSAVNDLTRVNLTAQDGNHFQSLNTGFHTFPVSDAARPPQRSNTWKQTYPETATVMVCRQFPPTDLPFGSLGGTMGVTHTDGIILFHNSGQYSGFPETFFNSATDYDTTPPYGNNYGPPCLIKYVNTQESMFSSFESNFCGYQGPMWHGRIFSGRYAGTHIGNSGAGDNHFGIPVFMVEPSPVVFDVKLLADITSETGLITSGWGFGMIGGSATLTINGENSSTTLCFPTNPLGFTGSSSSNSHHWKIPSRSYTALVLNDHFAIALSALTMQVD